MYAMPVYEILKVGVVFHFGTIINFRGMLDIPSIIGY